MTVRLVLLVLGCAGLIVHAVEPKMVDLDTGEIALFSVLLIAAFAPVLESFSLPGGASAKFRQLVRSVAAPQAQLEAEAARMQHAGNQLADDLSSLGAEVDLEERLAAVAGSGSPSSQASENSPDDSSSPGSRPPDSSPQSTVPSAPEPSPQLDGSPQPDGDGTDGEKVPRTVGPSASPPAALSEPAAPSAHPTASTLVGDPASMESVEPTSRLSAYTGARWLADPRRALAAMRADVAEALFGAYAALLSSEPPFDPYVVINRLRGLNALSEAAAEIAVSVLAAADEAANARRVSGQDVMRLASAADTFLTALPLSAAEAFERLALVSLKRLADASDEVVTGAGSFDLGWDFQVGDSLLVEVKFVSTGREQISRGALARLLNDLSAKAPEGMRVLVVVSNNAEFDWPDQPRVRIRRLRDLRPPDVSTSSPWA